MAETVYVLGRYQEMEFSTGQERKIPHQPEHSKTKGICLYIPS